VVEEERSESDDNHNPSPSPASKRRKSQEKKYEGRRRFTDEEKRAIKEGVREKGMGKWAEIKELYWATLQDRTSQQIKVGIVGCFGILFSLLLR
jgi:hypothetical protein